MRGVQLLADYDLSFDIGITIRQLASTIRLVEQCPDMRFMLDHIAKPDIHGRRARPVAGADAPAGAAFPNVTCKISGVVTEADPAG